VNLFTRIALPLGLSLLLATPAVAAPPALCSRWTIHDPSRGFPSGRVYEVVLDEGQPWVATDNGLATLEADAWRVIGPDQGLPHPEVWGVAVAPNRDVWAATAGGLARLSGGRVDVFHTRNSGLPADLVYDVTLRDREVWVATAGGLARLDTDTGAWQVWTPANSPLPVGTLQQVQCRGPEGWGATFGAGRWRLDEQGRWQGFADPDGDARLDRKPADGLQHDAPTTLLVRPDEVLVGQEIGLSALQGDQFSELLPLSADPTPGGATLPAHVLSLAAAGPRLYVGTASGLLVREAGGWLVYRERPGGLRQAVEYPAAVPGRAPRAHAVESPAPCGAIRSLAVGPDELWLAFPGGLAHCREAAEAPGWPPAAPPATVTAPGLLFPRDHDKLFAASASRDDSPASPGLVAAARIGLLLPPDGRTVAATSFARGAQRSLDGYPGGARWGRERLPIQLVTGHVPDLPWEGLAAQAALDLARRQKIQLLVVVGGGTPVAQLEVAQLARQIGLPVLLLGSDEPLLPHAGSGWVTTLGWSVRAQLRGLIQRLRTVGPRRLVLLVDDSRYAAAGEQVLAAELAARGLSLAGVVRHRRGQPLLATVQELSLLSPDALLLWAPGPAAGELLRALRAAGVGCPCFGPSALASAEFLGPAAELAGGCTVGLTVRRRPEFVTVAPEPWSAASGDPAGVWEQLGEELLYWLVGALVASPTLSRSEVAATLRTVLPGWSFERLLPAGNGIGGAPFGVVRGGVVVPE